MKGTVYYWSSSDKRKGSRRDKRREMPQSGAQSWILVISELHRYQGVSYKSDIIVISGHINVSINSLTKVFQNTISLVLWW